MFYGTEIQDICVLGWAMAGAAVTSHTKSNGDQHQLVDDALQGYSSCEEAALAQRAYLGEEPFEEL